jgi:hypothetical protein
MDKETLRTLVAAIILAGNLANQDKATDTIEIRGAITSADTLLAALKDPGPLDKKIAKRYKRPFRSYLDDAKDGEGGKA